MTPKIEHIIDAIIGREGSEYTNDPADSGGPTRWGITLDTLSRWRGTTCAATDVEALTRPEACAIYADRYVDAPGFNGVVQVSGRIGEELVDSGVNIGPKLPSEWLQRSLNVLNDRGRHYGDIAVDGDVGPVTIDALQAYLHLRGEQGETVLLRMLNALQGTFYVELAERRDKDERFVYGWFNARVA